MDQISEDKLLTKSCSRGQNKTDSLKRVKSSGVPETKKKIDKGLKSILDKIKHMASKREITKFINDLEVQVTRYGKKCSKSYTRRCIENSNKKKPVARVAKIKNENTEGHYLLFHPMDSFFLLMAQSVKTFSEKEQHLVKNNVYNMINVIEENNILGNKYKLEQSTNTDLNVETKQRVTEEE